MTFSQAREAMMHWEWNSETSYDTFMGSDAWATRPRRHPWAAWGAFVHTPDPAALAREFTNQGADLTTESRDCDDGLHDFEVADTQGYVLFFGHPR